MDSKENKKIKVLPNGPYQVTGRIPLDRLQFVPDSKGASTDYQKINTFPQQEAYYLCRCGMSKNKPFCDAAHLSGFDGKETASHEPYRNLAKKLSGNQVDLLDAESLCAVARFCDTHGSTWNLVTEGTTQESAEIATRQACNCPSGRLTILTKEGKIIEPELPQELSILEDPAAAVHGPIWVKGGIIIEDSAGLTYPVRNRVTLCRCGKSANKPFCDASHMQNKGELQ